MRYGTTLRCLPITLWVPLLPPLWSLFSVVWALLLTSNGLELMLVIPHHRVVECTQSNLYKVDTLCSHSWELVDVAKL
jgi:hypothetical protein